ncbi:cytochrome c [Draconibacterium sp. IB214405]|uniref:c-type cytochrome n=1 Tax=Draconibacterium sp. IB214405 TaxID=3097352 RepID=UPI002A0B92E0|nr:cytochrome c [Draconibacterium sp. IB214405]MDX8341476.1 cytochrome c [Draconibacterium sp. IB214405]
MSNKIKKNKKIQRRQKEVLRFFAFCLLLFAFSSCDYNRRTTGWQYFDDMVTSPAYESYTPNPNFADGKTMQPPVAGTIPRGKVPYAYQKTDEDRALAATTLINNLEPNKENLQRGEKMYGIYCMQCHGEKGDGQGSLYVRKKYTYPPASLLSEKMLANPEGDIYHVITVGHGIMGEHGSMIKPDDRWKIAMYVKEVLQN